MQGRGNAVLAIPGDSDRLFTIRNAHRRLYAGGRHCGIGNQYCPENANTKPEKN